MRAVQGTPVRGDALLSVVWFEDRQVAGRLSFSKAVSAVQAGREVGLAVLSLVLRGRDQQFNGNALRRRQV